MTAAPLDPAGSIAAPGAVAGPAAVDGPGATARPGALVGPRAGAEPLDVSVVVPVYRGAVTLPELVAELRPLTVAGSTPGGTPFRVCEVVLVWDHGPDASDEVLQDLAQTYPWVSVVWLSRNFGQHPATIAGLSATRGDWVVTMDEDGQHDPADIPRLLDQALTTRSALVYARPSNKPPHSVLRNAASAVTKRVFLRGLSGQGAVPFHSFRLIHGEHARAVAAFCGPGVYLDVALGWVIGSVTSCPARMRTEGRPSTSYSPRRLLSHLWRLVLSSGNRPLRLVSLLGLLVAALGTVYSVVLVVQRITGETVVQGWTSAIVATLIIGGLNLLCLGVIAEYVGMAASMSMGKPVFVATSAPFERSAGRTRRPHA